MEMIFIALFAVAFLFDVWWGVRQMNKNVRIIRELLEKKT